jgi:hypothetical protein
MTKMAFSVGPFYTRYELYTRYERWGRVMESIQKFARAEKQCYVSN